METIFVLTVIVIGIAALGWLGSRPTAGQTGGYSPDIIECKSEDDLRRFTGRPVAPPDRELIRKFKEMDDADLRHYSRHEGFAAD